MLPLHLWRHISTPIRRLHSEWKNSRAYLEKIPEGAKFFLNLEINWGGMKFQLPLKITLFNAKIPLPFEGAAAPLTESVLGRKKWRSFPKSEHVSTCCVKQTFFFLKYRFSFCSTLSNPFYINNIVKGQNKRSTLESNH